MGFNIFEQRMRHLQHVGELARVLREVLPCYVSDQRVPQETQAERRPEWCSSAPLEEEQGCDKRSARLETLLIEGHTDSQPLGANSRARDNWDLSSMRAAEILRMIRACEPELMTLANERAVPVLSVSGYAFTRLVDTGDQRSAANRRIDLRFLMELPDAVPKRMPEPAARTKKKYEG